MSTQTILSFFACPYPNNDLLQHGSQFLELAEINTCSQVCKAWSKAMEYNGLWLQMIDNAKYPRIEGSKDAAKEDFKLLHSITYSAKKSAGFGKFIGQVPMISAKIIELLKTKMDPYESHKKMSETFVIVVEPTHFQVPYAKVLFDDLVKNGDLEIKAEEKNNFMNEGLLVPYSLKNLKVLAEYAASQKGRKSIFNKAFLDPKNVQQILDECSQVANTVKVTVMRIEVPPQSYNMSLDQQKDLFKEKGLEMAPLCTRFYYNLTKRLEWNAVSGEQTTWSDIFSRTAEKAKPGGELVPVVISDYTYSGGICFHLGKFAYEGLGAAPILSAQAVHSNGA